jgi:histidyl-tRNA synthetase
VAVIIRDREVADGTAIVRDLAQSEQEVVPRDTVADRVRKLIETPVPADGDPPPAPTSEAE